MSTSSSILDSQSQTRKRYSSNSTTTVNTSNKQPQKKINQNYVASHAKKKLRRVSVESPRIPTSTAATATSTSRRQTCLPSNSKVNNDSVDATNKGEGSTTKQCTIVDLSNDSDDEEEHVTEFSEEKEGKKLRTTMNNGEVKLTETEETLIEELEKKNELLEMKQIEIAAQYQATNMDLESTVKERDEVKSHLEETKQECERLKQKSIKDENELQKMRVEIMDVRTELDLAVGFIEATNQEDNYINPSISIPSQSLLLLDSSVHTEELSKIQAALSSALEKKKATEAEASQKSKEIEDLKNQKEEESILKQQSEEALNHLTMEHNELKSHYATFVKANEKLTEEYDNMKSMKSKFEYSLSVITGQHEALKCTLKWERDSADSTVNSLVMQANQNAHGQWSGAHENMKQHYEKAMQRLTTENRKLKLKNNNLKTQRELATKDRDDIEAEYATIYKIALDNMKSKQNPSKDVEK